MGLRYATSYLAGHPNKLCDQIADAVVDTFLREDPHTRMAVRVLGSPGMMLLAGKVRSRADFDCAQIASHVYREVGYKDDLDVFVNLDIVRDETTQIAWQSSPICVTGFATNETKERLPRPITTAHSLARHLDHLRLNDPSLRWLLPDGSVSVTFAQQQPELIALHVTHSPDVHVQDVRSTIFERLLKGFEGTGASLFVNPDGPATVAGFAGHSGTSGNETPSDLYHHLLPGMIPGLSGKDPWHAERCGSYAARFVALCLLEQTGHQAVLCEALYLPGVEKPHRVTAQGMSKTGEMINLSEPLDALHFDWRPTAIVERFQLQSPQYRSTAVYGHVGRNAFAWEKIEGVLQ